MGAAGAWNSMVPNASSSNVASPMISASEYEKAISPTLADIFKNCEFRELPPAAVPSTSGTGIAIFNDKIGRGSAFDYLAAGSQELEGDLKMKGHDFSWSQDEYLNKMMNCDDERRSFSRTVSTSLSNGSSRTNTPFPSVGSKLNEMGGSTAWSSVGSRMNELGGSSVPPSRAQSPLLFPASPSGLLPTTAMLATPVPTGILRGGSSGSPSVTQSPILRASSPDNNEGKKTTSFDPRRHSFCSTKPGSSQSLISLAMSDSDDPSNPFCMRELDAEEDRKISPPALNKTVRRPSFNKGGLKPVGSVHSLCSWAEDGDDDGDDDNVQEQLVTEHGSMLDGTAGVAGRIPRASSGNSLVSWGEHETLLYAPDEEGPHQGDVMVFQNTQNPNEVEEVVKNFRQQKKLYQKKAKELKQEIKISGGSTPSTENKTAVVPNNA